MLQINKTTGTPYQGKNQAILLAEKDHKGYKSNEWLTFVQARTLGRKLVNAKGCGIHLRTFIDDTEFNKRTNKSEKISRPKSFVVFNSDLLEEVSK